MQQNLQWAKYAQQSLYSFLRKVVIEPITKYYWLIVVYFMLSALPDIAYMSLYMMEDRPWYAGELYAGIIDITCYSLLGAYLLSAIYNIVPLKQLKYGYLFFSILLCLILFLLELFCFGKYGIRFTKDFAGVIAGTNINETSEFLDTYIDKKFVCLSVTFLFLTFFIQYGLRHLLNTKSKKVIIVLLFASIASSFVYALYDSFKQSSLPMKHKTTFGIPLIFFDLEKTPDLRAWRQVANLQVPSTKEGKPQYILFIIGESFSKSHSSLYGYWKATNPRLDRLRSDSLLFVYSNITSAATHTVPSLKCMLSTYKPEYEDSINWYQCETVANIANSVGYRTYWYSNQSKHGAWDNVAYEYAKLCAEMKYCGEAYSGMERYNSYDEELLPVVRKALSNKKDRKFFFIHMMGSHGAFGCRYPESCSVFTEDEYSTLTEEQRATIASYDNSVLYNDYVVSELLNMFNDKEAVAIYSPDHALDLYESSPEWCGHAIDDTKSEKFGTAIPFMIYTSPLFQEHFPETTQRIKECVDRKFRTDDLIYTIMDLIGMKFADNDDVAKYSLFRE